MGELFTTQANEPIEKARAAFINLRKENGDILALTDNGKRRHIIIGARKTENASPTDLGRMTRREILDCLVEKRRSKLKKNIEVEKRINVVLTRKMEVEK